MASNQFTGNFVVTCNCKNVKRIAKGKKSGFPDGNDVFEKVVAALVKLNAKGASVELLNEISHPKPYKQWDDSVLGRITKVYFREGVCMRFSWDESGGEIYNLRVDNFHDRDLPEPCHTSVMQTAMR